MADRGQRARCIQDGLAYTEDRVIRIVGKNIQLVGDDLDSLQLVAGFVVRCGVLCEQYLGLYRRNRSSELTQYPPARPDR
jgi:hypothetical protein